MTAFAASDGRLFILFRSASEVVHRDMYLLVSEDRGEHFKDSRIQEWNVGQCVMSTGAFAEQVAAPLRAVLAAWETRERVYFGAVDTASATVGGAVAPAGQGANAKHPTLATNARGEVLIAWTVGTAFGKGGEVAWQVFDRNGQPLLPENGRATELPVWGLVAAFARPDGGFVVLY